MFEHLNVQIFQIIVEKQSLFFMHSHNWSFTDKNNVKSMSLYKSLFITPSHVKHSYRSSPPLSYSILQKWTNSDIEMKLNCVWILDPIFAVICIYLTQNSIFMQTLPSTNPKMVILLLIDWYNYKCKAKYLKKWYLSLVWALSPCHT